MIEDEAVVGVRFDTAEGPRQVRARNGVVLATGGFECDKELRRAFLRGPMTHPVSIRTNTGDGLKMAMKAGAAIGHVAAGSDSDFLRGEAAYDRWWGDPNRKGRRDATLGTIGRGPFYAIRVNPGGLGTKGGRGSIPTPACSTWRASRSRACTRRGTSWPRHSA